MMATGQSVFPLEVSPGPHTVVYWISEGEGRGRRVPGRLLTSPGAPGSSGQGDVARPLVLSRLNDRTVAGPRVVAGHGPGGVVGRRQGPCREVVRQRPCPLEGPGLEVVEVGRRDQVDRVEGLVEAVGMLVEAVVHVRQPPRLVQGGGRA